MKVLASAWKATGTLQPKMLCLRRACPKGQRDGSLLSIRSPLGKAKPHSQNVPRPKRPPNFKNGFGSKESVGISAPKGCKSGDLGAWRRYGLGFRGLYLGFSVVAVGVIGVVGGARVQCGEELMEVRRGHLED